jgi:hypothetical protein
VIEGISKDKKHNYDAGVSKIRRIKKDWNLKIRNEGGHPLLKIKKRA